MNHLRVSGRPDTQPPTPRTRQCGSLWTEAPPTEPGGWPLKPGHQPRADPQLWLTVPIAAPTAKGPAQNHELRFAATSLQPLPDSRAPDTWKVTGQLFCSVSSFTPDGRPFVTSRGQCTFGRNFTSQGPCSPCTRSSSAGAPCPLPCVGAPLPPCVVTRTSGEVV